MKKEGFYMMNTNAKCNMSERDRIINAYNPFVTRTLLGFPTDSYNRFLKLIFYKCEIKSKRSAANKPDNIVWTNRSYVQIKEREYYRINFCYQRIFELCKIIGVNNIYDIGCKYINQSFLLSDYTRISYIGIDNNCFVLNDFNQDDYMDDNIYYSYSDTPPLPFCGGRISFVKKTYPYQIQTQRNNIAISAYSVSYTKNQYEIESTAKAFERDFERVIFNTPPDSIHIWKKSALKSYYIYPIGYNNFVFASRYPQDINKLQEIYPFSNGCFSTGIDNFNDYIQITSKSPNET